MGIKGKQICDCCCQLMQGYLVFKQSQKDQASRSAWYLTWIRHHGQYSTRVEKWPCREFLHQPLYCAGEADQTSLCTATTAGCEAGWAADLHPQLCRPDLWLFLRGLAAADAANWSLGPNMRRTSLHLRANPDVHPNTKSRPGIHAFQLPSATCASCLLLSLAHPDSSAGSFSVQSGTAVRCPRQKYVL